MDGHNFCLKWDSFHASVTSVFNELRCGDELVDVSLCCDGGQIGAHRVMLSACSPYFRNLFKNNQCQQMVFFMKDVSVEDLYALVEFMYKGSVNLSQSRLPSFIRAAELLQIRGLSGGDEEEATNNHLRPPPPQQPEKSSAPPSAVTAPASKRRRHSGSAPSPLSSSSSMDTSAHASSISAAAITSFASPSVSRPDPDAARSRVVSPAPPPPVSSLEEPLHQPTLHDDRQQYMTQAELQQQQSAAAAAYVKVEKIDLTSDYNDEEDAERDDTEPGLESDISGHVPEYDDVYGEQTDGSMMSGQLSAMAGAVFPGDMQAGPSGMGVEEGSGQANAVPCNVCGRLYQRVNLVKHMKIHQGNTTVCPICGRRCSMVHNLRAHLRDKHRLTKDQVKQLVPTRTARTFQHSIDTNMFRP